MWLAPGSRNRILLLCLEAIISLTWVPSQWFQPSCSSSLTTVLLTCWHSWWSFLPLIVSSSVYAPCMLLFNFLFWNLCERSLLSGHHYDYEHSLLQIEVVLMLLWEYICKYAAITYTFYPGWIFTFLWLGLLQMLLLWVSLFMPPNAMWKHFSGGTP